MFGKRSGQPRTAKDRARAAAERASGRALPPDAFADAVPPPDAEPPGRRAAGALPPDAFADAVPPPDAEPPGRRAAEYTPAFDPEEHAAAPGDETPRTAVDGPSTPDGDGARPAVAGERQHARRVVPGDARDGAPADDTPRGEPPSLSREVPDVVPTARRETPRLVAARRFAREEVPVAAADDDRLDDDSGAAFEDEAYDPPPSPRPLRAAPARPTATRRRPAPPRPRRGAGRPTGEGHWGRRIFAVLALILIAAALYAINGVFQPFHGDGHGAVQVTVPAGADAGQIAGLLHRKGVVASAIFFEVDATVTGKRGKMLPGRYVFRRDAKYSAILSRLTTPPKAHKPPPTVTVRFTEGPSLKEMAPLVERSHKVTGSYLQAATRKAVLRRIRRLGAPRGTKTPEGFLFPATYTLVAGSSARRLVAKQLAAFRQNFGRVNLGYARSKHLTRYDVLIIASMIEREAELPRERPLVAAVIYNRLERGMPLGIDATIRYWTNNWQRPIRVSQLNDPEPYNTRLNRGLPPTPIGNPGLASLRAAAHPAHKPYLFYVRKPGSSGAHAFSSTDAQFEKDVARYQRSRGGP